MDCAEIEGMRQRGASEAQIAAAMNATFTRTTQTLNANTTAVTTTIRGQIMWDGKPVIDDDDGGTAGVREPRRPTGPQGPPPLKAELEMELSL